ncbi:MAG: response regulator [Spirochaetes bacterium]|nr:response regulator [Spirochaetota bacterium]
MIENKENNGFSKNNEVIDDAVVAQEENLEEVKDDNLKFAGKIVLVVDDILYVVKSISKILRDEGFFVLTAQTGLDAIKKVEQYSPDLVTIDQKLPDMMGTKLVEEIRKIETGKKTKIIFISALYDKDKIKSILHLGVDNYLLKPFKKSVLVNTIKKIFNEE